MAEKIKGLTSEEVLRSRKENGENLLRKERHRGFFSRFFENLSDPIIKILLIALGAEVIFTFGNCNYFEIGGIVVAILIATTVSTVSEYGSEKAFEKMTGDSSSATVKALRDGEVREIRADEIVVGDVLYAFAGDKLYADGVLLSGKITVDQSALNGESIEVAKQPSGGAPDWDLSESSMVFSGTTVKTGNATYRVGRVGQGTFYGMVAKDVQSETRVSPLKLRLTKLASTISKIGYVMAAIVALAYFFNVIVVDGGFSYSGIMKIVTDGRLMISHALHAFTLMITVIVVSTPEGLPMMITVVLSANMKRMLKDNVLVKKLVGIETAGSLNLLFTDKTGTITEGILSCDRIITASGVYKSVGGLKKEKEVYSILKTCAHYNTDTRLTEHGATGGNSTDLALFEFFSTEKLDGVNVRSRIPFSSDRKFSSIELASGSVITKGAPEVLLGKTHYALNSDGISVASDLVGVRKAYNECVCRGERVICVTQSAGGEAHTFVALVVLKDKIRKDVRSAVNQVQKAGIQVVMITGDGKETATAIAEECGIFRASAGHVVLGSDELHSMSDSEVKALIPRLRVVSRALPRDKTRLVRLSQEMDMVVGMTGDGINDAPSLKLADVGFAMGGGTDIAKSASDVIILDNSFSAIKKTVLYGRTIFKSIRKFITFQLIMNFAACGVSLIGQFIGIDNPITIIQMLWINVIMDTLGGLAFAGEAALEYYMKEKPKKRDERILSLEMIKQIALTGGYTLMLCTVFLTVPHFKASYPTEAKFYTAFYALFIFCALVNCLLARCERMWIFSNLSKNKAFIVILLFVSIIQISMIYFGGSFFRCVPLTAKELGFVFILSLTVFVFDLFRRVMQKLS